MKKGGEKRTLDEKAMATLSRKFNRKGWKRGHFKRDCPEFSSERNKEKKKSEKHTAHKVSEEVNGTNDSDALIVKHVAMSSGSTRNWIVDSGATCHMGND